jgi:DNA-binding transcriptional LysR family regulator
MSPSAVTRLVGALEERIGARLFTRTTRSLALTEAGIRLHADAGRILAELAEAEAAAAGEHQAPRGTLRITAPVLFGQFHIAPVIPGFLAAYPQVTVNLDLLDRVVHLLEEGIDVALRIGTLPDSTLSAIRVGMVRLVTVAAPAYLEAAGTPATPEELAGHQTVNASNLHRPDEWHFQCGTSLKAARITPRLTANTAAPAIDNAIAGWGITRVLSYQVADALADGRLVEILRPFEDRELPVQLVHPEGRRAAAKTRAFIDFAAAHLRAQASRLSAGI